MNRYVPVTGMSVSFTRMREKVIWPPCTTSEVKAASTATRSSALPPLSGVKAESPAKKKCSSKKAVGKTSGKTVSPARMRHQPPSSSDWLAGPQNSRPSPLVSWYQAGNPPPLGPLSVGPTRSRTAWAGVATAAVMSAASAGNTDLWNRDFICVSPQGTSRPWRYAKPDLLSNEDRLTADRGATFDVDQAKYRISLDYLNVTLPRCNLVIM